jgi:2-hydroxychromene-2-carboxylate isomerase
LNVMARPAAREPGPLVTLVRCRTVAAVFGVADLCEGLRRAGMRGLWQGGKDLGDLAELMPTSYPA